METLRDSLLCRLCGTNLTAGEYKNIFERATNLVQKIKETLPINISLNDDGSKHICLRCYDKIGFYYKFVQEVVSHTKELNDALQKTSEFDLSKEVTDFSKIHSDAVYSCPNCNVDLMILLVSNPQGCDYTFQISLAVVGNPDKDNPANEKPPEMCKSMMRIYNEDNVYKNENEIAKDEIKVERPEEIEKIANRTSLCLPVIQEENFMNSNDTLPEKDTPVIKTKRNTKRKLPETKSSDISFNPEKIARFDETKFDNDADSGSRDYDSVDTLVKIEYGGHSIVWVDSETDCKSECDPYAIRSPDVINNTDDNVDENVDENDGIRVCPKIMCELCGARYLSRSKYEFHMERHRLNKIDKYECTLCDKETSSENLLWDHYFHTHKSLQRFACTECGKLFTKRSRLKGHQKSYNHSGVKEIHIDTGGDDVDVNDDAVRKAVATEVHGKVSVNCNLCGKLITDLDPDAINDLVTCANCEDSTLSLMVDGNLAKVISPRQYHCSMCPKHFVRKERLEFHEMRHNENMNEFICSTCGKDFSAENSLYEHYLFVHKGARPHICELCGKSFQLKARLKEHHRTHTGERPYQCDVCGQRCRTSNALKLHRKIHFSHNRYTCNICNKSFSKKQNMNEHLEKHWKHDKNVSLPQLFTCPICVEDFPTYRMLKYHMVEAHKISNQDPILTKQKPLYECPQCHEKFKHQMSLKAHKEKVHEGRVNPVYECNVCNATYRIKQLLINHIKSKHDGEKRYKCAQCEKGFNDTKSLYNHILLHTGKKPFACEYCNMSFRRKDSRDHHQRKHTGEQPYQCPDCGESFSTYNNRSKHRKREHGEGETECPECGEKCNGQQEIRIHLNKHLGEKLKQFQNAEAV